MKILVLVYRLARFFKYKVLKIFGSSSCFLCGKQTKNDIEFKYGLCIKCVLELDKKINLDKNYLFKYECEIKPLLFELKFNSQTFVLNIISHYLKKYLRKFDQDIVIISVPSSMSSIKKRGYCHLHEICKILAKEKNIKYYDILKRKRNSKEQKSLDYNQRTLNLIGDISVKKTKLPKGLVVLIDDIYTTGSTIKECSNALKTQGIAHSFIVIAKVNALY